ncbi:MAG: glycosyltransferase [Bacteroidetes bacterium]|jgi:glycosyltransferase involved in cell wall biosynthesis|nr:glycosyltransferase [Bacteroidota bacterium]
MRILVASNSYPTSKNPTRQGFVKHIAEGLRREGHQVDVVYNRYFRFFTSEMEAGNALTSFLKVIFLIGSYLPVIINKGWKYDIFYSHAPVLPGLLLTPFAKWFNVKHVTYAHGSVLFYEENKLMFKLSKYTLERCDRIFTNSRYMKEFLKDHYHTDSVIVTPGYHSEIFKRTCRDDRPIDLLFAGSCIRRKGVYTLLDAIYNHSDFYRNHHLSVQICCSGREKSTIVDFCKKNQLNDIITFRPKLPARELTEAYNRSRIVVFPSEKEALGLVGIEAIACGAFLIASNTGGIPEYLQPGKNGLLFEPGDADDLHSTIRHTFDKKLWENLLEERESIEQELEEYSLDRGILHTVSHFKELLSGEKTNR